MKKVFKISGITIALLLALVFILGLLFPKKIVIVREGKINAPKAMVMQQIRYFKNWPNWSPWIAIEPTVKMEYGGIDGEPNSYYKWRGDETGEGKMTNISGKQDQLNYKLEFIKPWKGKAEGYISTKSINENSTNMVWSMTIESKYPLNIFNFITEKIVSADFEKGIELLNKHFVTRAKNRGE